MIDNIGSECNITTGKLDSNAFVEGGSYPFFTCAKDPITIDQYSFDDDVVLVAGNNAQGNFHVNRYKGKFDAYQRTYILTTKGKYSTDFIYYTLKLKLKKLKERSQGSQTKFLTLGLLSEITIPEINNSEEVGNFLSLIDSKISLNNRINQELEAMAKLIYDYWFVQFDFPISAQQAAARGKPELEDKPYRSSGGKMVYNEALKREIPEGWCANNLSFYLDTELGGTPSTSIPDYWNGDIPWLNSGEIASFPIIRAEENVTLEGVENSATTLMPIGTCVLSITRHLRPSIIAVEACANQSVVGIYENDKYKSSFIYPYLKNEIPRLMSLRTGAQQPHINKRTVDDSPYLDPPSEILEKYYAKVDSMYERIVVAAKESQKLSELRDWLLPMLMNGQVRIREVEEKVSIVAEEGGEHGT